MRVLALFLLMVGLAPIAVMVGMAGGFGYVVTLVKGSPQWLFAVVVFLAAFSLCFGLAATRPILLSMDQPKEKSEAAAILLAAAFWLVWGLIVEGVIFYWVLRMNVELPF